MRSIRFALSGLIRSIRDERNMRFHLCAVIYVSAAGYAAKVEPWAWAALFLCFGAVLTAECFNTALEAACDEITRNLSAGIRRAKDAAAAAVLMSAAAAVAVGGVVFLRASRIAVLVAYAADHPLKTAFFLLSLPVFLFFIYRR